MKETIHAASVPRPVPLPEELAFVEIQRTADILSRNVAHLLKAEDLSSNQYNVLRILRGAAEGLPCGEIAARMISRDPDITRLLDRLEKRSLISRCREARDRRMVMVSITAAGKKLLARTDSPIREAHTRQLGHLGPARLHKLTDLLKAAREHIT